MLLHLGQDFVVNAQDVVGVFDMESASSAQRTREFLKKAQSEKRVVNTADDLPKSFVVCVGPAGPMVYLSVLSSGTLQRRLCSFDAVKKAGAVAKTGGQHDVYGI